MNMRRELLIEQDSFLGPSHRVEAILGEGSFGVVAKCRNIDTNQRVAIKVNKPSPNVFHLARVEIDILKKLRHLDPETSNIVSCQGFFFHKASICLTFELLDLSLNDYIQKQQVPVTEVRSVLGQMSSALSHLSSIGIVHADIKPDNIMVVDRHQKPIQVKLIDFGLALTVSACKPGVFAGTIWYMAPEMTLLGSFNEAIDMWSLGQTVVELITGRPLYPGEEIYDIWRFIIDTQGQPEDHVLDQGQATENFFTPQSDGPRRWRLKTPKEVHYMPEDTRYYFLDSLDDLEERMDYQRGHHRDHRLLVDLIKKMLCLDQEQRIKPLEVLQHPFLSESLPQSSCADVINDMNNVEESEEDQEASENQTAGPEDEEIRIQIETTAQAAEPEDEDIKVRTETTAQAAEPEDGEIKVQPETTAKAEEPVDEDIKVQTETTAKAEEPVDEKIKVQPETTFQDEEPEDEEIKVQPVTTAKAEELVDEDIKVQTETTSLAEEPEDEEIWILRGKTSQAEEPEDERIQEEEIESESRKERVGWFRRALKSIRNTFRFRSRESGKKKVTKPLETSV